MPIWRLTPGEWKPDLGEMEHEHLVRVRGAVPYGGGWVASPVTFAQDLAGGSSPYAISEVGGLYVYNSISSTGDRYVYVGTADRILRSNVNNLTTVNATAGALGSSFDNESGWQFVSYGEHIWATNYGLHIFEATTPTTNFVNAGGGTGGIDFAAPVTYRPRAKFITTIKNHLLIANVRFDAAPSGSIPASALTGTIYPSLVMWSATDNPRRFGDPNAIQDPIVLGSDWQDLNDEYGPITGLIGGDSAYIFKTRAIYRMDGPPWTFRPVSQGTGTYYPNSIIKFYDDLYFWGIGGITRLRSGASEPEPLSIGKCKRFITDNIAYNLKEHVVDARHDYNSVTFSGVDIVPLSISGFADYKSGIIGWFVFNGSADSGLVNYIRPTVVVLYNTYENSFGMFSLSSSKDPYNATSQRTYGNFARGNQRFASNTDVVDGASRVPSYVLDGVYFISGETQGIFSDSQISIFGAENLLGTGTRVTSTDFQNMEFEWSYQVPEGALDQKSTYSTRITKARVLYKSSYDPATDSDVSGADEIPNPAGYTITIKSTSRPPQEDHSVSSTYEPYVDTFQDSNGWISIETVYATHHKISIELFEPTNKPGAILHRALAHIIGPIIIELQYAVAGEHGSDYRTS